MVPRLDAHEALRAFLSDLHGWSWQLGDASTGWYAQATAQGRPVMGLGVSPEARPVPTIHFAVDDAAAAAARARELGATVLFGPQAVLDLGTTVIVRDPAGATVGLWQAGTFAGFGAINEPGAPGWFDHVSRDADAAGAFYSALTGATLTQPDASMSILAHGDAWFASLTQRDDVEAQWMPVVVHPDLAAARRATVAAGGTVVVPEMPVPGTTICVVADPVIHAAWTVMAAGAG